MVYFRSDGEKSGQTEPPSQDSGSVLKAMLHRVDPRTGRFVRLQPDDRQLYLPFLMAKGI
jgi:hypothetical protein